MEPITREEYYLAKIAGTYEGKTPEPVTIEEYYLATMAGDYSGNTPQPVTRLQYYMAKVAGVWDGSIPAPVTRLEYYWAAIANGKGTVFPPVTREEHFLVLVADAYSVVLTVVTGNPALLENSKGNRGLESLTLYGKSTQGSTPSPSYPQEIENAGQSGEIGVQVLGKNLIPFKEIPISTNYGITITTKSNGVVHFKGTATRQYDSPTMSLQGVILPKGFYRVLNISNVVVFTVVIKKASGERVYYAGTVEIEDGDEPLYCYWYIVAGHTADIDAYAYMQVDNGKMLTESDFEPYKPAQKLIIPTPGGLPGIPVSSGGNYTGEKGQQWVCDEIDLANGERVQWIGKTVVDGEEVKFVSASGSNYWNLPYGISPGTINGGTPISRYFARGTFSGNNKYDFVWTTSEIMKSYFDTPEELNAFCVQKNSEGNPLTIYYCIETPIRTPLPPETIAAYKALRTYSPTTTVINDADAGMSVGYKKAK